MKLRLSVNRAAIAFLLVMEKRAEVTVVAVHAALANMMRLAPMAYAFRPPVNLSVTESLVEATGAAVYAAFVNMMRLAPMAYAFHPPVNLSVTESLVEATGAAVYAAFVNMMNHATVAAIAPPAGAVRTIFARSEQNYSGVAIRAFSTYAFGTAIVVIAPGMQHA
jgi:hypothetical protein